MSVLPQDPYNRILRAAKRKRGIRLTAEDVHELSCDDSIETRAAWLASGQPDDRDWPGPCLYTTPEPKP